MCVGACGLVAQCDEYQLGGNEKSLLTCVFSESHLLGGESLKPRRLFPGCPSRF